MLLLFLSTRTLSLSIRLLPLCVGRFSGSTHTTQHLVRIAAATPLALPFPFFCFITSFLPFAVLFHFRSGTAE